ncbi:hypothetical protein ACFLSE_08370 [Bacteroidota bacterium]
MKKISILLPLILTLLLIATGCEEEDSDPVNIPDTNFLAALIEKGVDTNGDGLISPDEAELITSLDVNGAAISDLTGIESFVSLKYLYCNGNQLSSLDVSNNTELQCLYCNNNQLTNLDVTSNINLTMLEGASGPGTSLTLPGLDCSNNQLTSLDISNNTNLVSFSCSDNLLTNLDISNNTLITDINLSDNPNLAKVCVWVIPFPPSGVEVDTTNSSNVYFTTDCSK